MFGDVYFDISEYEEIPNFKDYSINKKGMIYSAKSGTMLDIQKNKKNQTFVRMINDEGTRKRKYIVKLLLEVFKTKNIQK